MHRNVCFNFRMPRACKSDAEWEATLKQYAIGKVQFKTGQKPGKEKWRKAVKEIECCPSHHLSETDDNHNKPSCSCGYHEVGVFTL